MADQSLQNLQSNARTTQQGVSFTKQLFGPDNTSLNPVMILNIMKGLGFNVPKNIVITVDVAQMIMSGAALYTAADEYESLDDFASVVNPAASVVLAAESLAEACGWLDPSSDSAQIIKIGADAAMLVGSGGMDVTAWIALGIQLASMGQQQQQTATVDAYKDVSVFWKNLVTPEAKAAAGVFKQYQESEALLQADPDYINDPNYLSVFGMVGKIAQVAPDLWPTYFPHQGSWAPTQTFEYIVNTTNTSWDGNSVGGNAEKVWTAFQKLPKAQIQAAIFNGLVVPYLTPFQVAHDYYLSQNKASIYGLCMLATLANIPAIGVGSDLSGYLDSFFVTPADMGETVLQDWLKNQQDPSLGLNTSQSAVSIQGVSSGPKASVDRTLFLIKDKAADADLAGRIDLLRKNSDISKFISNMYTFPVIDPRSTQLAKYQGGWNEGIYVDSRGGQTSLSYVPNSVGSAWRNPRDFFSALAMLDQIQHDSWFSDWYQNGTFGNKQFQSFDFLGNLEAFKAAYAKLQLKSVVRRVNRLALANIAGFLGTTPDKLSRTKNANGNYVYTVKGN